MTGSRLAYVISGTVLCPVLALSGCSSSSSHDSAQPATSPASGVIPSALASAASSALPGVFGSGGPLDVSKLCAAVPSADVQKLFKAPAPALTAYPGECSWGPGGVTIDIFTNDANKKYYSGGGVNTATAKQLAGVGDIAQWAQPVPGATVPFMVAHKGTVSISVSPDLDVSQTTMAYTGSAPIYTVSNAAAAKYAAEEGQICNDIFAAANA